MQGEVRVRSIWRCVTCLCLLLTLYSAVGFAAHHHAKGTTSANCTFCITAHASAPAQYSNLPRPISFVTLTFRAEPVCTKQRLVIFALSVRPPPEV